MLSTLKSRSGSIGVVAVVPPDVRGFAFGSFQIKFRLQSQTLNPYFVAYFLNSPLGKAQIEKQKTGSIQMNITIDGIKALKIPIILNELQNKIIQEADALRSRVNNMRIKAEQIVIAAKSEVEQIILNKIEEG